MPPVGAAIAAGFSAFTGSAAFAFATQTVVGRLMVSVATSALLQAIAAPRRSGRAPVGFGSSVTLRGGTNPARFPLGRCMTAGQHVCPPMTHGAAGKTPNAYMTYVILLSNVAGAALEQVIINDQPVTLGATPHPSYGQPVQGDFAGYAWVKYYSGSQTVADPYLLGTYGSYPERPWSSAMIGRGLCYAILTFRISSEVWAGGGHPRVKFVMGGIPLYDIRKDSTAGGSGAHRWNNRATWEPSNNPFVQIYNIKRGITLADGDVWGGEMPVTALDTASYVAAMNECDRAVAKSGGGTEPQFRSGIEVTVDRQPTEYVREILAGASGQVADIGGLWKARAGGPGVPVFYFDDGDVIVSKPEEFKPFPGLEKSFNAITASYPEPANGWEPKDAPARYNAAWETEDQGRRRVAHLELPAVPWPDQVQRVMKAYIEEERRFRRHALTLPPAAAILEPLDAVGWTSTTNGYVSKVFEVNEVADDLRTCLQRAALRERDPADYDYPSNMFLPSSIASSAPVRPAAQAVPAWTVAGISIADATGAARVPALRLSWDGTDQDDVTGLEWEVRLSSSLAVVARGSTQSVASGQITVTSGIVGATGYQARGRFIAPRETLWSNWVGATTPNIGITNADFVGGIEELMRQAGLSPPEIVTSLPTSGNYAGRTVFLTTNSRIYRHTGSPLSGTTGWTDAVDGQQIIAGTITAGLIAVGAISGDLGHIRDFSVDTLQIKGQAVTVAAIVQRPETRRLSSLSSWVRIASITLTRERGLVTELQSDFTYHGYGTAVVKARYLRGSTMVGAIESFTTGGNGSRMRAPYSTIDVDTSGGKVTYHLECQKGRWAGYEYDAEVMNCIMRARQFQR